MLDDPSAQEYKRSRELEIAIEHANESIPTAKIEILQPVVKN